jgi:hypothetical protein
MRSLRRYLNRLREIGTKIGASVRACAWLFVTATKTATKTEKEKRMTKLPLLGAAVVLSFALAGPVMAKHAMARHMNAHAGYHVQNAACDPRDPGNPFSERFDYTAWTAWRIKGGWDTRAEWTCQPIPEYARH